MGMSEKEQSTNKKYIRCIKNHEKTIYTDTKITKIIILGPVGVGVPRAPQRIEIYCRKLRYLVQDSTQFKFVLTTSP